MRTRLDVQPDDTADSLLARLEEKRRAAAERRQERWRGLKESFNMVVPLSLLWAGINLLLYLATAAAYFADVKISGLALLTTPRPAWLLFQITVNVIILAGIWLAHADTDGRGRR